MFWLRNKKINFLVCSLNLSPGKLYKSSPLRLVVRIENNLPEMVARRSSTIIVERNLTSPPKIAAWGCDLSQ